MEEYDCCFEQLELSPDATPEDVRRRYRYLKKRYSSDSIEIRALGDDFSQDIRADYLSRLDKAFEKLCSLSEKQKPFVTLHPKGMDDELRRWVAGIECFTGEALKAIRERLQVDLKTIFAVTRIQPHLLEDIEREAFKTFRAEVYLRSYLIEYARFLGLDTQRVLNDYLPRYRDWMAAN